MRPATTPQRHHRHQDRHAAGVDPGGAQQVLKDQQVNRLEQAVQNVSGVLYQPSSLNQFDSFLIRGFETGDDLIFRNGLRVPRNFKRDLVNIDRVDVPKGPASVLNGRVEPGGIINFVTKKPLHEAYYSLEQEFGFYDFYRTEVDAAGPLNADRSLLYRFNLAYLNTGSFRDFLDTDRVFVAPSLTWRPREDTEFNVAFEYLHEDQLADFGIPVLNKRPAPIPISRQFSEPDGPHDNTDVYLGGFYWSHRFNGDWAIRNGVVIQFSLPEFNEVTGGPVLDDGSTVSRFAFFANFDDRRYIPYLDLTGQFELWGTEHQVLLGVDYFSMIGSADDS